MDDSYNNKKMDIHILKDLGLYYVEIAWWKWFNNA